MQKLKYGGSLFCLSFTLLLFGCKPNPMVYKLYFLGGQSNMTGFGESDQLHARLKAPVDGVMIYEGNPAPDGAAVDGKGVWAQLRPGHGVGFSSDGITNSYSDRFGPEITFARRMRALEPGVRIAIIKYARNGSSIDSAAAGEHGCWEPDFGGANDVNQYDHFLAAVRSALSVKDIDGDGEADILIPAGIVWMQGESDAADTEETAKRYAHNLKRLMDLIRAAFRMDDLPVVIGRISDSGRGENGNVWEHGQIIRAAQARFVKNDANAALIVNTDRYKYSDIWHYDSVGYIDLGRQFAEALYKLQNRAGK